MIERNGESGESHRGMITAKIKEVSREVVCEEILKCSRGIRNEIELKNIEKGYDEMNVKIAEGFKEVKDQVRDLFDSRFQEVRDAVKEQKEGRKWTIERTISIIFGLVGVVALIVSMIRG